MTFKEWNKAFDKLRYRHETWYIFRDWLDMTIDGFTIPHQTPLFTQKDKYTGTEYEYFGEMLLAYINTMQEVLRDKPYFDFLGEWWESDVNMTNKFNAQFFTPCGVTDLMVDLTYNEYDEDNVLVMNDPCCGSGRFALSWHHRRPQDWFVLQDLDDYAVKMSVLNMLLHGMRGVVVHGNTLTREVYCVWQVSPSLFEYGGLPYIVPYRDDLQGALRCLPQTDKIQAPDKIDQEILTIQKGKQKGPLDKWIKEG